MNSLEGELRARSTEQKMIRISVKLKPEYIFSLVDNSVIYTPGTANKELFRVIHGIYHSVTDSQSVELILGDGMVLIPYEAIGSYRFGNKVRRNS